jgi:hypothetical protein
MSSDLRNMRYHASFRQIATAAGTYVVSHGLSFGTAFGTVPLYNCRITSGDGYVTAKAADAFTLVATVVPCVVDLYWEPNPPNAGR